MANTVDILGEQETLDRLIAHSLDSIEDDRVTSIRRQAFYYNDTLKSANFPNVVTIDWGAFLGNTELESANFPNATSLGGNSFSGNSKLNNINIPKVTNIGSDSFSSCYCLNAVNIPNATTIGSDAFKNCYSLKSAVFSSELTTLNSYVFNNCFSLNSIDLQNIKKINNRSLDRLGAGTIVLPNCTSLGSYMVSGTRISTLDLYKVSSIQTNCFNGAYSLVHLILRNSTRCSLSSTNAFTNTPIANGIGWIYVPSELLNSYKTASNWSTYASQIVSIDEYPKALSGETITDTWDEIFQAENNGTYKTKYSVGDTKYLVVGGTYVLMQIIAFDRDILSSDNTSTAKITWLSKGFPFEFPINIIETNNWKDCLCRDFLNNVIYEQIDSTVKNKILAVDKTYMQTIQPNPNTSIVSDKLWIPSMKEMFNSANHEASGINYSDFFTDNTSRKKNYGLSNTGYFWWLRSYSSNSDSDFYADISSNGASGGYGGFSPNGVVLGFCT